MSAVAGIAHGALTVHGTIGDLSLILHLVLELVLVLLLGLVARAVTIAGAIVELILCLLLSAQLILRPRHRLIGGAVAISIPILFVIDTGGNRTCRFGGVGLSQGHALPGRRAVRPL